MNGVQEVYTIFIQKDTTGGLILKIWTVSLLLATI